MPETQLDLSRLALERSPESAAAKPRKPLRRKWISRYVVPCAILGGFAILIFSVAGQSLWPAKRVEVIPVIVKKSAATVSGTPLFQSAGWIEPRPMAINVPALASGVIDELLVVEGQSVEKGEPIARLISIDAQIAVQQAQAELATAEGELNRAHAEQRAAKTRLEQPVHLKVQLADAKSFLAKAETEMANLPFQIEVALANFEFAKKSVKGKRAAGGSVTGIVLMKAESELVAAGAQLRELQKREPSLKREIAAFNEKVAAIESQLDLLTEETWQLADADAKVQSATASRDSAKLQLQIAKLEFDRNTVRAPITGRVLHVIAAPGTRVVGIESDGGQHSGSVVEMYDPKSLQVRADVRLEDFPLVALGQPVEVDTASSNSTLMGRVLQPTSTANIQKNTLEVKVELIDPPDTIRPEMLVTATFLAPDSNQAESLEPQLTQRLFIPKSLVQSTGGNKIVWTVDQDSRARKSEVVIGDVSDGELIEITSGLNVTDKLIASGIENLSDGTRVLISGEDRLIGR